MKEIAMQNVYFVLLFFLVEEYKLKIVVLVE